MDLKTNHFETITKIKEEHGFNSDVQALSFIIEEYHKLSSQLESITFAFKERTSLYYNDNFETSED